MHRGWNQVGEGGRIGVHVVARVDAQGDDDAPDAARACLTRARAYVIGTVGYAEGGRGGCARRLRRGACRTRRHRVRGEKRDQRTPGAGLRGDPGAQGLQDPPGGLVVAGVCGGCGATGSVLAL